MILVRLTGGLGNQLFQYALGTHLALKNRTILKIDTSLLLDHSLPHEIATHRELDLDIVFQVNLEHATMEEVFAFNGTPYAHLPGKIYNRLRWELFGKHKLVVEKKRSFQPEILLLPDSRCLVGAWQSEKYFQSSAVELRKLLKFRHALTGPALELAGQIESGNSLCISTRRGDYVSSPVYRKTLGAVTADYFTRALELMRARVPIDHLYVFSDDEAWSRENLHFPVNTTFVSEAYAGERYSTKFQLMTLCKHFIIPNSTFGWWAAWLGTFPGKVVIAPDPWYLDRSLDGSDIVPETWFRVKRDQ